MIHKLYDAAVQAAVNRWPNGEALAAAAMTDKGNILTSVWVEAACDAACLCAETGVICEAHKLNERIVQVVCVTRDNENEQFKIMPACGICQERLAFFGMNIEIAVSGNSAEDIVVKTLSQLRPDYWQQALK